ncbi:MAG: hypothetical protein IJN21_11705 [Clostridia bacterium]|nr:hypothetical protein [Clostridia bacterium]
MSFYEKSSPSSKTPASSSRPSKTQGSPFENYKASAKILFLETEWQEKTLRLKRA